MNRQAMHSYLMNGGADRDGMKASGIIDGAFADNAGKER